MGVEKTGGNASPQARAALLSLAEAGTEDRSYISFPFGQPVPTNSLSGTVQNCIDCQGSSCSACLFINDGSDDVNEPVNPNLLCTGCTSCTIQQNGGFCGTSATAQTNFCDVQSCSSCYRQPGVLVNYPKSCQATGAWCQADADCPAGTACDYTNSRAELCGWGWNAYQQPSGDWLTGWTYRQAVTIQQAQVSGQLADYPVYLDLSAMGASFFSNVKADGSDIVVTDETGTVAGKLARELEGFDKNLQKGVLWFKAPALSDTVDTVFYVYYGNNSASESDSQATWSSVYSLVQHLDESSGSHLDSAGVNNSTEVLVSSQGQPGAVGSGDSFDGLDDHVNFPTVINTPTNYAYGGWFYLGQHTNLQYMIVMHQEDVSGPGEELYTFYNQTANRLSFNCYANGDNAFYRFINPVNPWALYQVYCVNDGINLRVYINGQPAGNPVVSSPAPLAVPFQIGGFTDDPTFMFTGRIDEVRVGAVAATHLSPEWIATEYSNINSPNAFYQIGPAQTEDLAASNGLGWIAFKPDVSAVATPYTSAIGGNIFSESDINATLQPPLGKYNAAYLIDAGGTISQWKTSGPLTLLRPGQGSSVENFFPDLTPGGLASSSLAKIDVNGIINALPASGTTNRFGSTLVSNATIDGLWSQPLSDKVYKFSGPQTTNAAAKTVKIGSGTNSGAGIIYIDGDLNINSDIVYQTTDVSRFGYIPSLVWIVKGDVTIAPNVNQVAGTFIVLGDGNPASCPLDIEDASDGCGRFFTGDDSLAKTKLRIFGNVLARQIKLERSYAQNKEAAEEFISDGRLQANTPGGLSAISQSLPRFSSPF